MTDEHATYELVPYGTIDFDATTPTSFKHEVVQALRDHDRIDVKQHEPTGELVIYELRPFDE